MFRIIFVLDLLNGCAVHALRGERSKYQPVQSMVVSSSDPMEILTSIAPREVYIADLDHIQHTGNNFDIIKQISEKMRAMVDIGAQDMTDVVNNAEIADSIVLGTETVSLDLIEHAIERFPGRIIVSLDMKNHVVLTEDRKLRLPPKELVRLLNGYDFNDMIILNLSSVGTSSGIDADFLREIAGISNHNILVGGGIRDLDDIDTLQEIGVKGALMATAVHNGKIPVAYVR